MSEVPGATVWWADPRPTSRRYVDLLPEAERARLRSLRQPADQGRFLTAAALLRLAVAAETGTPPDLIHVDRSCPTCDRWHGRPRVPGTGLEVSITHSGDRVGVALTRLAPIGIDVQVIGAQPVRHLHELVLGGAEHAADGADFYRYWTRKESAVKATGDGIAVGLSRVQVSAPSEPARLVSYPAAPGLPASMLDLDPGDGYVGAVTVLWAGRLRVREQLLAGLHVLDPDNGDS